MGGTYSIGVDHDLLLDQRRGKIDRRGVQGNLELIGSKRQDQRDEWRLKTEGRDGDNFARAGLDNNFR
jgi:hypothetical protein